MCLAADVPLIESGTTGFNGQVQVIKRGMSECYDCNPKETPKSFPVCTIRSTPSQPIHCIVWAKSYLFAEIFGTSEDEAPDLDTTEDADNAVEIEKLRAEANALKRIRESMGTDDFARQVFYKVFKDDIDRLRSMDDMWRTRKKPEPLNFDTLSQDALDVADNVLSQDQTVWTDAENFAVFTRSLKTLSDRLDEQRANAVDGNATPVLSFDKDDKDTLDFVASAANLRSIIFSIERKSEFEIKRRLTLILTVTLLTSTEMAGNIIPAIATTNAMTASLCVLQSLHVLRTFMPRIPPPNVPPEQHQQWQEKYEQAKPRPPLTRARMTFLVRSVDRMLSSEQLRPPNPHCSVCGVAHARVQIDLSRATLRDLVEGLLKGKLAYRDELAVSTNAGLIFDPDLDDNLDRPLSELGVSNDSSITITDEEDTDTRVNLVLNVKDGSISSEDPSVKLLDNYVIKHKPAKEMQKKLDEAISIPAVNGNGHLPQANGLQSTKDSIDLEPGSGSKRKRGADEADLEADMARKKGKVMEERPRSAEKDTANGETNGAVTITDEGDGAIVIDD